MPHAHGPRRPHQFLGFVIAAVEIPHAKSEAANGPTPQRRRRLQVAYIIGVVFLLLVHCTYVFCAVRAFLYQISVVQRISCALEGILVILSLAIGIFNLQEVIADGKRGRQLWRCIAAFTVCILVAFVFYFSFMAYKVLKRSIMRAQRHALEAERRLQAERSATRRSTSRERNRERSRKRDGGGSARAKRSSKAATGKAAAPVPDRAGKGVRRGEAERYGAAAGAAPAGKAARRKSASDSDSFSSIDSSALASAIDSAVKSDS